MTEINRPVPMPRTAENAALGIGFERRMPDLKRGDRVSVWCDDRFWPADVVRRCPGPVYWAKIASGLRRGQNVLVSCGNYGGRLNAD